MSGKDITIKSYQYGFSAENWEKSGIDHHESGLFHQFSHLMNEIYL